MNRGRVGEERGGKDTDVCPLTVSRGVEWSSKGMDRCPLTTMPEETVTQSKMYGLYVLDVNGDPLTVKRITKNLSPT
jgi:hypothetical protein